MGVTKKPAAKASRAKHAPKPRLQAEGADLFAEMTRVEGAVAEAQPAGAQQPDGGVQVGADKSKDSWGIGTPYGEAM